MCDLSSLTKSQDEIRRAFQFDTAAPIVHVAEGQRVLALYRWYMPSLALALESKRVDPGVTIVRNTGSPHWHRWLGPQRRCVVPLSSLSEDQHCNGRTTPRAPLRCRLWRRIRLSTGEVQSIRHPRG